MATIRLRFAGRFVLAEPATRGKNGGELNALAVRMRSDTKQNRHRSLMTIARGNLAERQPANFLPPLLSLVGPTKNTAIEHLVWDVAGWDVATARTADGFSWSEADGPRLPDLAKLEETRGKRAVFQSRHIKSRTADVVSRIQVAAGSGSAPLVTTKKYNFAPRNNAKQTLYPQGQWQQYGDFVDIELSASTLRLEMVNRARPALRRAVNIRVPLTEKQEEAVVRFSNLCPLATNADEDEEFMDYYALFDHNAKKEERLVAKETDRLGEAGSVCFLPVRARY